MKLIDIDRASRAELVSHIDELEFLLEQVMPRDADVTAFRAALDLSAQQASVLAALANGRVWAPEQLVGAVSYRNDGVSYEHIKVLICMLRKKLPRGVSIKPIYGAGWCIPVECLPMLRSKLAA